MNENTNTIDHEVDLDGENSETHKRKDHYHGEHHIYAGGMHDDVNDSDFVVKNSFKYSKRNLIFKISSAGIFLALTIVASALDMMFERVAWALSVNGVTISFRYLDLLVTILSIGTLGPLFSSLNAFIAPWMHYLIDAHGNPLSVLSDSMGYVSAVWLIWFFYYLIFKNSYFHKTPDRNKDWFKRWIPMPFFVIASSAIFTLLFVLTIWLVGHNSAVQHNDLLRHAEENGPSWSVFVDKWSVFIGAAFGLNVLRFSLSYSLFALIEPKMKILNHRFR